MQKPVTEPETTLDPDQGISVLVRTVPPRVEDTVHRMAQDFRRFTQVCKVTQNVGNALLGP